MMIIYHSRMGAVRLPLPSQFPKWASRWLRLAMGDPFSVATGIAGLLSLGLQVSGGLIKYYRTYSTKDEDLHNLLGNAERLQSLLCLAKAQQLGTPTPASDGLHKSLEACSAAGDICAGDVKSIVQKYARQQHRRGFKERGQGLMRKLRYPFDKEKFEELRTALREFNAELLANLQLLSL